MKLIIPMLIISSIKIMLRLIQKLNKEDFKRLMAGFYTLNVEVITGDQKANIEGIIKFTEKDISVPVFKATKIKCT